MIIIVSEFKNKNVSPIVLKSTLEEWFGLVFERSAFEFCLIKIDGMDNREFKYHYIGKSGINNHHYFM